MSKKQAIEEVYCMCLFYLRVTDIVEDMIPSYFVTGNTRAAYIRYIKRAR